MTGVAQVCPCTLDLPGKYSQLSKRGVEPGPLRALHHSVTLRPNGTQLG